MVHFPVIKIPTIDFGMGLGGKRNINCVPEEKVISSTAGDNRNFISARILLQININKILFAYFS